VTPERLLLKIWGLKDQVRDVKLWLSPPLLFKLPDCPGKLFYFSTLLKYRLLKFKSLKKVKKGRIDKD